MGKDVTDDRGASETLDSKDDFESAFDLAETGSFEGDPKTDAGLRLIALPAGMMAVLHELREYQREMADLRQHEHEQIMARRKAEVLAPRLHEITPFA